MKVLAKHCIISASVPLLVNENRMLARWGQISIFLDSESTQGLFGSDPGLLLPGFAAAWSLPLRCLVGALKWWLDQARATWARRPNSTAWVLTWLPDMETVIKVKENHIISPCSFCFVYFIFSIFFLPFVDHVHAKLAVWAVSIIFLSQAFFLVMFFK